MLATVKIVPFAVVEALARRAADIASRTGAIGVRLFQPRRVGLVQTFLPSIKDSVLDKTARRTAARLARSGSIVTGERRVPHDAASVAAAVSQLARRTWLRPQSRTQRLRLGTRPRAGRN